MADDTKQDWGTKKLRYLPPIGMYGQAFQAGYRQAPHLFGQEEFSFGVELDITSKPITKDQAAALLTDNLFTSIRYRMLIGEKSIISFSAFDVDNPEAIKKGNPLPEFLANLEDYKANLGLASHGWKESGISGQLTILSILTARMRQSQILSEDESKDFFDALPFKLSPELVEHLIKRSSDLIAQKDQERVTAAGRAAFAAKREAGRGNNSAAAL